MIPPLPERKHMNIEPTLSRETVQALVRSVRDRLTTYPPCHDEGYRAGVCDGCNDVIEAINAACGMSPHGFAYDVCQQCGVMNPCHVHETLSHPCPESDIGDRDEMLGIAPLEREPR